MTLPLFCYGTLQSPLVLHRLTGEHFPGTKATLHDYGVYRVRGTEYPGILPEKGSIVQGTLYRNIDDEKLRILDDFEGYQYLREIVGVYLEDGNTVEAYVYCIKQDRWDVLSQEDWDFDAFIKHELHAYLRNL